MDSVIPQPNEFQHWRSQAGVLKHRLTEMNMFSEAQFLKLLETHPREHIYVHTMSDDLTDPNGWRSGEIGNVSAAELLDAVKQGKLWINIKHIELSDGAFAGVINSLYSELNRANPEFRPSRIRGTLIISSPTAKVHYHADASPNILWHLIGQKRVWIYPPKDPFLADEALEGIFSREKHEEIPYHPHFEDHAQVIDLLPGEAAFWPLNSPHRVQNLGTFNVSLSTEHETPESLAKEHTYCANRFYRNKLGLNLKSTKSFGVGSWIKRTVFRLLRKLGFDKVKYKSHRATFLVDPNSPTGTTDR